MGEPLTPQVRIRLGHVIDRTKTYLDGQRVTRIRHQACDYTCRRPEAGTKAFRLVCGACGRPVTFRVASLDEVRRVKARLAVTWVLALVAAVACGALVPFTDEGAKGSLLYLAAVGGFLVFTAGLARWRDEHGVTIRPDRDDKMHTYLR